MEDSSLLLSLSLFYFIYFIFMYFLCVCFSFGGAQHPILEYWGCSSTSSTPLPTPLILEKAPFSGLKLTSVYILGDDLSALNVALF